MRLELLPARLHVRLNLNLATCYIVLSNQFLFLLSSSLIPGVDWAWSLNNTELRHRLLCRLCVLPSSHATCKTDSR